MNHRMWPKPGRLLQALKELDFYVDVDMFWSDAARAADLVLPAQTSYEREEVYAKRGGRFYFADRAVEPLGEAKNDIQIIMDVMKAMGLKDPVMEQSYEEYMAYILEPSGLTLEELKNHPEGMTGRNLYPPVTKVTKRNPFTRHPARWRSGLWYWKSTGKAMGIQGFPNTAISGRLRMWTGANSR